MKKEDMLAKSADLLVERGNMYGEVRQNFARIAACAMGMLGRNVTMYEVAVILLAVKLGRMSEDPTYVDSYLDGINYLAIAGELGTEAPNA
jgi:hypothetical protein